MNDSPTIDFGTGLGILGLLIAIGLIVLGILWIIIPFIIFGISHRLDRLIVLQRDVIALQREQIRIEKLHATYTYHQWNSTPPPQTPPAKPYQIELTTDKNPLG